MEIEIAQEVEVRTQRRKRAVPQTAATQSKKNKPTAAKGSKNKGNTTTDTKSTGSRKRKPRTTKPLTKAQRDQVATINVDDVYAYVNNRVPGELITDLFPDRLKLWEFLTGDMAKLNSLIDFAVTQYLALYHECSKERSKCSELFLRWLDFVRSVTCVSEHTPETIAILKILDNSGAGLETTMTVLAVIMNAVYMGVQKQMSKTVEELSNVSAGIPEGKPSDETSLHRICGWALKSTIDYTSKQSKQRQADNELDQKQQLLQALKLPQNEKSSLPAAVQYLDRGGMTFMQLPFTKWMRSTDEKITTLLNQRSYTVYGEKIFEATHTCMELDTTLLSTFTEALHECRITSPDNIVSEVHSSLLNKVYNARCNEFLQTVRKLSCIDKNQAVDASVGLRDKLKVFATEKCTLTQ